MFALDWEGDPNITRFHGGEHTSAERVMAPRPYIDAGDDIRFRAVPAKARHVRIRGGGRKPRWRIASITPPATARAALARSRSTRGGRRGGANAHDGLPGAHE
jgi:hypothetical protein